MAGTQAGQGLPTVTGFAVRPAIEALRNRDCAVTSLLRRAGLSVHDLATSDGGSASRRITAMGQARLLEYAAEALDDSAFGLHLAQDIDPRDAGILFYVMSGAKNVGEGLSLLARYFRIVNEAVRLKLTNAAEDLIVEIDFVGLPRHSIRQNAEFGVAAILKSLRQVAGRNIRPDRVAFAHPRNSNLREFERFYGCSVEFGRAATEEKSYDLLAFSNDTLAVPFVTADAKLLNALQPFCDIAAKERATAKGTLRAAVENEVTRLLPHGKAQARTVAKALALSVRTLSRRLADEGTSFADVVDQLRRSLALQYLKEPGTPLAQIAWLLGYEGSTSFNHAFKRWTGRSPSAVRGKRRLLSPD
jgi:AraC-like DNA-binding protein